MIFLKNISYHVEVKELFNDVSFSIFSKEKIGLVGKNGSGKTTILNLIQKNITPDKGDVELARNINIVTVSQEVNDFETTVLEYVESGVENIRIIKNKMLKALSSEDFINYSKYQDEYEALGGYTLESQASKLLNGLGFSLEQLYMQVKELSGGWQIRLNLAQALLQDSDVLLLDEPTNHLDLDAVMWLENYLKEYSGALLLISHDRIFLDNVVNNILAIESNNVNAYKGNYSDFEKQSYERKILQQKQFEKQQENIQHLESFITR